MGNCYLKKKSITNYNTNYFYSKQFALLIEVIGLKKLITQLPITKTKKYRYEYMYGREKYYGVQAKKYYGVQKIL